jgi:hypothetical protein
MQPILITKDIWELVIDGYTMPSTNKFKSLSVDDKKFLKELIKKDNEALYPIGSAIEESIFMRINDVESSKQA